MIEFFFYFHFRIINFAAVGGAVVVVVAIIPSVHRYMLHIAIQWHLQNHQNSLKMNSVCFLWSAFAFFSFNQKHLQAITSAMTLFVRHIEYYVENGGTAKWTIHFHFYQLIVLVVRQTFFAKIWQWRQRRKKKEKKKKYFRKIMQFLYNIGQSH